MVSHVEGSPPRPRPPSVTSVALRVFIGLLVLDAILEMSFVSSTVAWLNDTAGHEKFRFVAHGSNHRLSRIPRHFLVDQAYVSDAAAVVAIVIVGFGSVVSLPLRNWCQCRTGKLAKFSRCLYYIWLCLNVAALLITGVALVYAFAVTNARAGQRISKAQAITLDGRPYEPGTWTPQSWFSAVLRLKLVCSREEIVRHLIIMRGWQYNLIPMFILHFGETVLAFMDYNRWIRKPRLPASYTGF